MTDFDWLPDEIDPTVPSAARIYDYMLGGVHNFAVDREFGDQLIASWPISATVLRGNRSFLRRAVGYLVREAGITQLLDIGSGIPTVGNVHEVAHAIAPDVRVMYVDIDPIAVSMSQAILAGTPNAAAIHGDFNRIDTILTDPTVTSMIDFGRPVAVLVVSVLHFVSDAADPAAGLARIRDTVVDGSYLALSHATSWDHPDAERLDGMYRRTSTPLVLRPPAAIAAFFDGYDLVEPGLVPPPLWRAEDELDADPEFPVEMHSVLAGVGRRRR